MDKLPEPKSCCFCMNVRTGSLVIGVLALLGSLFNIISWVSGLRPQAITQLLYKLFNGQECVDDNECKTFVYHVVIGATITSLVLESLHVIMSSLLLHGIRKEKPGLFMPYMSWLVVRLLLLSCITIGVIIVFRNYLPFVIGFLTPVVISIALEIYFFFVINAHRMEIRRVQGASPMALHC